MSTEPTFITIPACEVKPYHYAMWTSTGGEPYANCICGVKWSEDGAHLWLMLESRNFHKVAPDEEIEVVDITSNPVWTRSRSRFAEWTLPAPPVPRYDHAYRWSASGPECDVCGSVHQPNLEPMEEL